MPVTNMHAVKLVHDQMKPALSGERIHDNVYWRGAAPRLSVCVPVYRHDATALMDALASCASSSLIEIILYDDGSGDGEMLAQLESHAGRVPAAVRIVSAAANRGRSAARNAAIRHARSDWRLLMDVDMIPDDKRFLEAYLDAIDTTWEPAVIVGGYSLKSAPHDRKFGLHRWQAEASECLPAAVRNTAPARYVFSSNVLVHRLVLDACPFDERFAAWGWEDTDWGLRAQQWYPIRHIDNTATHMGLDSDKELVAKYARSGANFALMTTRHQGEAERMPLYRMAKRFRRLPMRKFATRLMRGVALFRVLPLAVRGRALKAWRALVYAEALG
jgi:glycosyltransferase involved in cell wall biosynthesis